MSMMIEKRVIASEGLRLFFMMLFIGIEQLTQVTALFTIYPLLVERPAIKSKEEIS